MSTLMRTGDASPLRARRSKPGSCCFRGEAASLAALVDLSCPTGRNPMQLFGLIT